MAFLLVDKRALCNDLKVLAHFLSALRERQPRRKAGERKATGLLTSEVAGLPNSGGALEKNSPHIKQQEGSALRPHNSTVTEPRTQLVPLGINFYQKLSHSNKQPEARVDHHGGCPSSTSRMFDSATRLWARGRYPENDSTAERNT